MQGEIPAVVRVGLTYLLGGVTAIVKRISIETTEGDDLNWVDFDALPMRRFSAHAQITNIFCECPELPSGFAWYRQDLKWVRCTPTQLRTL